MKNTIKKIIFCFIFSICSLNSFAVHEEYTGRWLTVDDETEKPRSIVRLSLMNGQLVGHIEQLFQNKDEQVDPLCIDCKGELHNKKVIGMQILSNMKFSKKQWKKGQILDPKNGKFYDCKIWLEDGVLQVRGYIGFFYRTQQWTRMTESSLKIRDDAK